MGWGWGNLKKKVKGELSDFEDSVKGVARDAEDKVKSVASDADDWRRENPALAAMIPFTPENQALMAGGGALLGGGMALGGLGAGGAASGAGAAGGAAGAAGGMSLGNTLMGLGSIGASLYGANQAKKGAKALAEAGDRASALEQESADKQLALQKQIWEKQQADQLPYLQQGQAAIGKLGSLMGGTDPFKDYLAKAGLSGGQFNQNNPQYQFLLKQGQQALDRSAAARGMGYSGAQMKAAQQFGQGLASQQYDKEYDRASQEFGNYYNRLAALAQGGQQAVQATGNQGAQYAQNASNTFGNLANAQSSILGQQANARASGYAAQANAFNQGLGNMIDIYGISKKYG